MKKLLFTVLAIWALAPSSAFAQISCPSDTALCIRTTTALSPQAKVDDGGRIFVSSANFNGIDVNFPQVICANNQVWKHDGANGMACASLGGIGDAVLSATQTFSGANTFTSSAIIQGFLVVGDLSSDQVDASKAQGLVRNMWQVVAATAPVGISSMEFIGLSSNATYRLTARIHKNTLAGAFVFIVNNDTTAGRHKWSQAGFSDTVINSFNTSDTNCEMVRINQSDAGSPMILTLLFGADPTDATKLISTGSSGHLNIDNVASVISSSCRYSGTTISSLVFKVETGNFDGRIYLEQLMDPNL